MAIVGAACRLAGGINSLDGFWRALAAWQDLVGEVPPDRFDPAEFVDPDRERPGKTYTAAGAFLDDVAGFDADYFGLSPREASRMDPQHRLLLETAVEALDDAGLARDELAGSNTGVFVGVSGHDYEQLQLARPETVNNYSMFGVGTTSAANRISHVMDWHGESVALDTACSSSLTALHHAYEYVRDGRGPVALSGGVHLVLGPFEYTGLAAASMLSPTGRCRAFSADADGFVRSEGAGMLVLKPLDQAVADGDRIHAVIVGSAVNNDGHTAGLALPNTRAQEALLLDAYGRAGVEPDQIGYLEAHGTGTSAGDPQECGAIGRGLARKRTVGPLPIGSVKTNIGHLEAAAGVTGVAKALLILRHRRIPATLHTHPRNPDIDFAGLNLRVTDEPEPLPDPRAVIGVSSFGYGGSNAHVILGPAPERTSNPVREPERGCWPLVVSGQGEAAARGAALRLADRLAAADPAELPDIAYTACRRRGRREHRVAVLAESTDDAARRLRDAAVGADSATAGVLAPGVRNGRVGFVFSGNGSQWAGMGADLLRREPAFAAAVGRADAALEPFLGWSVARRLADLGEDDIADTEVAQPALFAVQVGLVALLGAYGVRPSAVTGHSVGETVAAYVSGALSLEQAARVVAARSRAQGATAGAGRMAAVGLSEEQVRKELADGAVPVEIAAVNSASDVTVAGAADAVGDLVRMWEQRGVFARELKLDYAFHTEAMAPVEQALRTALDGLRPGTGEGTYYSTVTGGGLDGTELTAGYWWRNARRPVRFADAVEAMLDDGVDVVVEVGPHPVLRPYLTRIAAGRDERVAVIPTCSRRGDGPVDLRRTVAHLLACGARIDWRTWFPEAGRVVDLPAYPWQRERHWNGDPSWWERGSRNGTDSGHPLLGKRLAASVPTWSADLDRASLAWLADHRVGGAAVLPGAALVELGLAAARHLGDGPVELRRLAVERALPTDRDRLPAEVQTTLSAEDGRLTVTSRADEDTEWQEHARGHARRLLADAPEPVDLDALRIRAATPVDVEEHYARLARCGLDYGPAFRLLTEIRVGGGEAVAAYTAGQDGDGYLVHPTVLDTAAQAGAALLPLADGSAYLPVEVAAAQWWRPPPERGWIHVRRRAAAAWEACWDVTLVDAQGGVALRLHKIRLTRFEAAGRVPLRSYETVLRAAAHPQEPVRDSVLPAPGDLLTPAPLTARTRRDHDLIERYQDLSAHFTTAALPQLLGESDEFTLTDLLRAGVQKKHLPLMRVLLAGACDRGLLERAVDGWRVAASPHPRERFQSVLRDFPEYVFQTTVTGRCGLHLPEVLRGARDPLELLFGDADRHLVERIYTGLVGSHAALRAARETLRSAVAAWPADRPLRVLEVGAGTGGTTAHLLDVLPPERTHYVYSDITAAFFPEARARFAAYDFLHYQTFDLEHDPAEQGLPEAGFDLVIASNVVHATSDLAATAGRLHRLLAPAGQLMAVECHHTPSLAPVFGLLDGFWAFTDTELRTDSPLLPPATWRSFLDSCGFTDVHVSGDETDDHDATCSLVLATRPGTSDGTAPPPVIPADDAPAWWCVVAEDTGGDLARSLAAGLRAHGHLVELCSPDSEPDPPAPGHAVRAVFLLDRQDDSAPDAVTERAIRRIATCTALAAVCAAADAAGRPGLWLVTRPSGALPAPETPDHPEDAAVWGAARCLANEHPGITVRRISLDRTGAPAHAAARLLRELLAPTAEDEVVLTEHGRFVARFTTCPALPPTATADPDEGYALEVRNPGLTPDLAWAPQTGPEPAAGEIRIAVRAAGLNYHDVLQAGGMLACEPGSGTGHRLGLECVGTVTAVGSADTGFRPGDRVLALAAHGALASHVVVPAAQAARVPAQVRDTDAATLPLAYFTVSHALDTLARLAPGETVLIHAGTGGIGLTALHLARARGARVIATAGTPAKRDLLRLYGVQDVLDSRSLTFAEEVLRRTGGRGVDVVLNSLAGESLTRSLELLAPGGRFVELGKRDIEADSALPMRPLADNISVFAVDAIPLMSDAGTVRGHLTALTTGLANGDLHPLPHHTYPAPRLTDAFRSLQHARHMGKVVITFDDAPALTRTPTPRLDPEATYLITGGLSGLGAATARHLGDLGARHLALLGRRGADTPEAPALLDDLRARGIQAVPYAVDVTDSAALRALIAAVDAGDHPLKGVIHAAMVLDDDALTELTADRIRTALAPKMTGGLLLDSLTRHHDLDFFVTYSSIVASIGLYRQGNYVAGNLALEALTRARRRHDRPAVTPAWGRIGDIGYVARNLGDTMSGFGAYPMTPAEAGAVHDALLTGTVPVAVVGRFDFYRTRGMLPAWNTPRLNQITPDDETAAATAPDLFRRSLATADDSEALPLAVEAVTHIAAQVLQADPERLDPTRSLDQLGMDSLLSTELAVALRNRLDCDLAALEITSATSLTDLARRVLIRLNANAAHPAEQPATTP
ncbi:SDR family NAD(P)-dependent oxidoreductase [Streptomyces sp. NPDC002446]